MDFTWVTPTDQTPLTTKGDIFAFSTVDARLPAGANETRLVADSTQTLGLKYVADTTNYAIAAKADLLVGTAADTLAALTVGTDGQVLTADSTVSPTGLKWATPTAGSTFAGAAITGANATITNNTLTTLAFNAETYDTNAFHDNSTNNSRITIPSGKAGYYLVTATGQWDVNAVGRRELYIAKNGTLTASCEVTASATAYPTPSFSYPLSLSVGDYLEVKLYQGSGGNLTFFGPLFSVSYLGA
jgi:hypothetical protein